MNESYQEKYSVRTEFNQSTGMPTSMVWENAQGQQDAPGDLPSEMLFSEKGVLECAFWRRGGKLNRPGDLPTRIYYAADTGKPYAFLWDKDDLEHREGDRPSRIIFRQGSEQLEELAFCKNGQLFRRAGQNPLFNFHLDGTPVDDNDDPVEFEGFDEKWLPDCAMPRLF
ncbi:hypothetical protein [Nitratireductor alexandrii]|uniref:hypothetical protein n=1 Tax=Nitratireductor alexandrii TaxID=2448161 RepID=UPI000FDC2D23|nr:hypothetical protein [Nitratireductor alexandrii]